MIVAEAMKGLRRIRESMGVSQDVLAKRTSVSLRTIVRAEQGTKRTYYGTALKILEAINAFLQERGREPVSLEDLELKLL